jgi:hypothetical protein
LPHYKLQLNNHYQYAVGVYVKVPLGDVLETALRLERNAIVYEEEMKCLREEIDYLKSKRSNSQSTVNLISTNRSRKAYNSKREAFNNYHENRNLLSVNKAIKQRKSNTSPASFVSKI